MTLRTRIFAATYDRQMATTEKAGLRAWREGLLAGAAGDVLEIGSGTGGNLPCYGPAVTSLTMTEPQPPMLRRLQRAASRHTQDVTILRAPAEDLPFDNGSFDVAVSTLVLCGVDDQPRALRELRRVLRPGGALVLSRLHPTGDWLRHGGDYFDVRTVRESWHGGTWDMHYWLSPLEVTCDEIYQAGFLIERLVEPRPLPAGAAVDPEQYERINCSPRGFIAFRLLAR
jgi:SAM-dependent methyltransferase